MDLSSIQNILDTFRNSVMWIAEKIASLISVPPENIYYLLFIALSISITHKIFFRIFATMEKRSHIYFIMAGVILFILAFLKLN